MTKDEDKSQVRNKQPLDAAQLETSLLNIKTVMATTGLSRSAIYARVKAGTMPAPIKIGGSTRWHSETIRRWIDSLAQAK